MNNRLIGKTARLKIRPLKSADFQAWKNANLRMPTPKNEWDLGGVPAKNLTPIEFRRLLKVQRDGRKNDTHYSLAIFLRDGTLIGGISVMEVSRRLAQSAFLGYRIFSPHWSQGFAKEAVAAALKIVFHDLKLHRIEAGIEPSNKRSVALAKSLGMRKEGLKKRSLFLRSKWVDLLMYSLTCEDLGWKFKGKIPKLKPRS